MWIKTHTALAPGLKPYQVWAIWSDINNRHLWDLDTEWAELKGPFVKGAIFRFKPKGGPKFSMQITDCVPNKLFTDCFKIPFAKLYSIHQMEETPQGLRISTSIKIVGLLGGLLRKMIGEKIVAEVPAQTQALIKLASTIK